MVEIAPTYSEIVERCAALARRFPGKVTYEEIGVSEEGRPLPAVTIGDKTRDLPLIIATGGMHGSEECGRAVAMAMAEWLPDGGAGVLENMNVVIAPCVNPDGTLRNQGGNAHGINLCRSFLFKETPRPAECRAVTDLVLKLLPDCYVDIHGLAGGAMGDYEFVYSNLVSNMTGQIGFLIASEMDAEAHKLGFPTFKPRLWGVYEGEKGAPCQKFGLETNALCMVVESTENYYPLEDSIRSGMSRLKKLLETGSRVHYNQPYPGFACDTIVGGPSAATLPFGNTYEERRRNRYKLMQAIRQDFCDFRRANSDPNHTATLTLSIGQKVTTFPDGVVFQAGLDRRARVTSVSMSWPDGITESLGKDATHGYMLWEQDNIPMVRVCVNRRPAIGENTVIVKYDAPFKPHVQP